MALSVPAAATSIQHYQSGVTIRVGSGRGQRRSRLEVTIGVFRLECGRDDDTAETDATYERDLCRVADSVIGKGERPPTA